jgi:hypothetical protein
MNDFMRWVFMMPAEQRDPRQKGPPSAREEFEETNTPLLHYSITPLLHYSISPSPHR